MKNKIQDQTSSDSFAISAFNIQNGECALAVPPALGLAEGLALHASNLTTALVASASNTSSVNAPTNSPSLGSSSGVGSSLGSSKDSGRPSWMPSWMPYSGQGYSDDPTDVPSDSSFTPNAGNPNLFDNPELKLLSMMQSLENDPGNLTQAEAIFVYVNNLLSSGNVSDATKNSVLSLMTTEKNGMSAIQAIVQSIATLSAYQNRNTESANTIQSNLQNSIDEMFDNKIPFAMQNEIEKGLSINGIQAALQTFSSQNSLKNEACWYASGQLGDALKEVNLSKIGFSLREDVTSQLFGQFKDPFVLFTILTMMLGLDGSTSQLGGYGNVSNILSKQNNKAAALASQFSDSSNFAPGGGSEITNTTKFVRSLYDLYLRAQDDPALSGIKGSVAAELHSLLTKPIVGADGLPVNGKDGQPLTIEKILQSPGLVPNSPGDPNGNQLMQESLYKWSQPTTPGAATPTQPTPAPITNPDYTTWMNNLKALQTAFANQSQTVSTAAGQISNNLNTCTTSMNNILNLITTLEKTAVQAQKTQ